MVAGGPPGFLPEGAGEGTGERGHGPGQGAVLWFDAEVAGEVVLVIPGGRADRGRLGCGEDGGIAVSDAAQHPLVFRPGRASAGRPGGGGLAGVAAELLRPGEERGQDLGQAAACLQDQQVSAAV